MDIIIDLVGGLGLFLYGMNFMGDGLQKTAGNKMKSILAALTSNKLMGVIVGALVTAVIQSSSATTVMVVGFVNAGLMNLYQAVGIIMGANIGTTVTAILVTLDITKIATFLVGIAVFVYLTTSKKKVKNIMEVVIGFGILFIGMDIMKHAMGPLKGNPEFTGLMTKFTNPFLGILIGFVMTAVLQSSSATTGLLIAFATSGNISFEMAYPIVFGQNIGTCVTALLSSIGANKTAKRAAIIHLLFNIFGTILFILFFRIPVEWFIFKIIPTYVPSQIAAGHVIFNVINVLIMFPFSNLLVKASEFIIKGKDAEEEHLLKYIDERLLATPPIALSQASREVLRLGKIVLNQFDVAIEAFITKNETLAYKVFEIEKQVNALNRSILGYLVKLDKESLDDSQKDKLITLMNSLNDIERVGDHADNIGELALYKIENNVDFSEEATKEIKEMSDKTKIAYEMSLNVLRSLDCDECNELINIDKEIDIMYKSLRKNHIERLNKFICEPNAGVIFLDTIGNLERIGDHSSNIGISILEVANKNTL